KSNEGLGFARNSGIEIATGEFLAFIDSDDYLAIEMCERLYSTAKALSLDTVYCGFSFVDNNLGVHEFREVDELYICEGREELNSVLLNMIGTLPKEVEDRKFRASVWHAIYSRKLIERYDIKFCSERQLISEDIIFHIDYLTRASKIAFLPDSLYYHCENGASLSNSYRKDRYYRYKMFSDELSNRLAGAGLIDVQLRIDRLFLGYVRSLIFNVRSYNINELEKKNIVKMISQDEYWKRIVSRYPVYQLPYKYQFAIKLISKNWFYMLMLLSKLK